VLVGALFQLSTPTAANVTIPFFRDIESYKNRNYENAKMCVKKVALEGDVEAKFPIGLAKFTATNQRILLTSFKLLYGFI